MQRYIVRINIVEPETQKKFSFESEVHLMCAPHDNFRLRPGDIAFNFSVVEDLIYAVPSKHNLNGEIIASPRTQSPSRLNKLISTLRANEWAEHDGHATFDEEDEECEELPTEK